MTIHSFTDTEKTYETTLEHCDCGNYIHVQAKTGGKCKHQKALIAACNRAMKFALLRMKFDSRLNGEATTQRLNFELAMGF